MTEKRESLAEMFRGSAPAVSDDFAEVLGAHAAIKSTRPEPASKPASAGKAKPSPTKAPKRPRQSTVAAVVPAEDPAPDTSGPTRAVGRPRTVARDPEEVAPRGFFVPSAIKKWLREEARNREVTQTDLLVMAFDAVPIEAIKDEFEAIPAQPTGGMPRSPIVQRKSARVEDGVQTSLRLSGAQEEWIDAQKVAAGAPSKSALVSVVLRMYRDQKSEK